MKKNNMVAMILAGGRGSRLFDLTKNLIIFNELGQRYLLVNVTLHLKISALFLNIF